MNISSHGEYNLYIISDNDIKENIFTKEKYILLLQVFTETDITNIRENIENLFNKNCFEIYSIGKLSEKMHDILDWGIVDFNTKNDDNLFISTTSDLKISSKEMCFYFYNTAGKNNNCKNYYALINNKKIEKHLKNDFQKLVQKNNGIL
jgi:hypothetical protein